jgi:serine/threonine protein phosphatase PrpC
MADPPISGKRKAGDEAPSVEPERVAAACSCVGTRPTQEDRYCLINNGWADIPNSAGWPPCRFYGVFDGHNGPGASTLVATLLWSQVQSRLVSLLREVPSMPSGAALEKVIRDAFAATEAHLCEEESVSTSGCTATCALVLGDVLVVANLGDSRTVLCHGERLLWQSVDHKPGTASEKARIEAAGGHVSLTHARGQINVPRLNGVLSVSRSLGDAEFKAAGIMSVGESIGRAHYGAAYDGAAHDGADHDGAVAGIMSVGKPLGGIEPLGAGPGAEDAAPDGGVHDCSAPTPLVAVPSSPTSDRCAAGALSAEPDVTIRQVAEFDSFVPDCVPDCMPVLTTAPSPHDRWPSLIRSCSLQVTVSGT